jgi:hypothetical protein
MAYKILTYLFSVVKYTSSIDVKIQFTAEYLYNK